MPLPLPVLSSFSILVVRKARNQRQRSLRSLNSHLLPRPFHIIVCYLLSLLSLPRYPKHRTPLGVNRTLMRQMTQYAHGNRAHTHDWAHQRRSSFSIPGGLALHLNILHPNAAPRLGNSSMSLYILNILVTAFNILLPLLFYATRSRKC